MEVNKGVVYVAVLAIGEPPDGTSYHLKVEPMPVAVNVADDEEQIVNPVAVGDGGSAFTVTLTPDLLALIQPPGFTASA